MSVASGDALELSEFQLYNGVTRLDAAATLTASSALTSGTLAALKDNVTTSGAYWSTGATAVVLSWVFPSAVDVDGVLLGARTTVARFPTCGLLIGSDTAGATDRITIRGFGGARFVSGAKTAVIGLQGPSTGVLPIFTQADYSTEGGKGLITDTVKTKATPANLPTHCKVRLLRDIDSKVIRETWTDPVSGGYRFDNFDEHYTYTVLAIHPTGSFRAVIADRITPGLMP